MKKIGLIGGTGPESTAMYYKELNLRIDKISNGKSMPEITIESVDFRKAWGMVSTSQYDDLALYLSEKAEILSRVGAEVIALTAGTMHIVYDEIVKNSRVELLSIPGAICDEVVRRGYKIVGMLGTVFTMEQDFMKKDLLNAEVEVIVPKKKERDLIATRILEELEIGIVKESTLVEFNEIIKRMRDDNGIEAVILGCTELPLLLNNENCVIPCLDSVEIHINKIIEKALG